MTCEILIRKRLLFLLCPVLLSLSLSAQPNGNLQIHFLDVGQGDCTLIMSPKGETVLVDAALAGQAATIVTYLQERQVTALDYLVVSHYDRDHVNGLPEVMRQIPLRQCSFDRGSSVTEGTSYNRYTVAVPESKRCQPALHQRFALDTNSTAAVWIEFVAMNGVGVADVHNENDRCLVFVLHFGEFDAVFGGDLSGQDTDKYRDVETSVADVVQQVELYKVHHHGSQYSSMPEWLAVTKPLVGVISCGNDNSYGHPTPLALSNLHAASVVSYWTERGKLKAKNKVPKSAVPVAGQDFVGGNIVVQVPPAAKTFTVSYSGGINSYTCWGCANAQATYVWSVNSDKYHYPDCVVTKAIFASNLRSGSSPPTNYTLHAQCPKK